METRAGGLAPPGEGETPGHFTHIYTARRTADLLASGEFTDWPGGGGSLDAVGHYTPQFCGEVMQEWEKFTAIGAIGPDLFYFSQDYNTVQETCKTVS